MPVQILFPPGTAQVGPGYSVHLVSDFIGPLPTGALWVLKLGADAEPFTGNIHCFFPAAAKEIRFVIGTRSSTTSGPDDPILRAGETVHMVAELQDNLQRPIDTGARSDLTYDPVGQLWQQMNQNTTTVTGGFTAEDRALLQTTELQTQVLGNPVDLVVQTASGLIQTTLAQLFSRKTLDRLTTYEVTDGPTCDPVRAAVGLFQFGVIVRVTTIAPELTPKTPDQEWYFNDLAVLRVFRGADLQYRRGIHTPTFLTERPWEWGWSYLNENIFLGTPPEITIAVDWRTGCCGQVFLLALP